MFIDSKLAILILVLTLGDQVHSGEIVGGQEAVPHSMPYMVLLKRYMPDGAHKHCGGFLLSMDFVMTAAHCQATGYKVFLGLHSYHNPRGTQHLSVGQTFVHEGYNATGLKHDIMLIKLSSRAKINKNVSPIALAHGGDSLPQSCKVAGWGRTTRMKNNTYMSPTLMEVKVALTYNESCVKNNVYCSVGEAGPDEGDSGGPLVCGDGEAYGVVSGFKAPKSGPIIYKYTKISDNKDWIYHIMERNGK